MRRLGLKKAGSVMVLLLFLNKVLFEAWGWVRNCLVRKERYPFFKGVSFGKRFPRIRIMGNFFR
jgi:hypothetical protein